MKLTGKLLCQFFHPQCRVGRARPAAALPCIEVLLWNDVPRIGSADGVKVAFVKDWSVFQRGQ